MQIPGISDRIKTEICERLKYNNKGSKKIIPDYEIVNSIIPEEKLIEEASLDVMKAFSKMHLKPLIQIRECSCVYDGGKIGKEVSIEAVVIPMEDLQEIVEKVLYEYRNFL